MYLVKRYNTWWAIHDVPRSARKATGKARFAVSLGTDNEMEARTLGAVWEARWRGEIDRVTRNSSGMERLAAAWREAFTTAPEHERDGVRAMIRGVAHDTYIMPAAVALGTTTTADLGDALDAVPAAATAKAARFEAIATGAAVALLNHVDAYLATATMAEKSKSMARRSIVRFAETCPYTADVTPQAVQGWIDGQAAGASRATVQRTVTEVRGLWRYMVQRSLAPATPDPFAGRHVHGQESTERKPFAPADVVRLHLLASEAGDTELADIIAVGMWTGARIEEIAALTVADVDLGVGAIVVRAGKTDAAARTIPVHPALAPTLARLIGGRKDGHVFADMGTSKYGDRSGAVSKRFGRLKKSAGFGEEYVYHSIRKTVATMLENAGVSENVAADILGHEKPRITYGLYSGGATLEVKAAAIRLLAYH